MTIPSIWIYGGVHHDPGTRQRFLEEFAKQQAAPHFVAVEWEKSFFEKFVQWRPWVEERLRSCRDFLTSEDRHELSLALAWEGDSYTECFPGTDVLWLETSFQEARCDPSVPKSKAQYVVTQLSDPLLDPKSKTELINQVWRKAWTERDSTPGHFDRDARWNDAICQRISDLHDGWIAVVIGWQHANPEGDNRRLPGLLVSRGFTVNSVYLGP